VRIYVASSWRNQRITEVVRLLRLSKFSVYDFREEDSNGAAFNWRDIDPNWQSWTPEQYRQNLTHPAAQRGFKRDMAELTAADGVLLVLPCNRSAHLELGYAIGKVKPTAVLLDGGEPELMYKAVGRLCISIGEAVEFFDGFDHEHGLGGNPRKAVARG
jgi:nucleoside 2-deoxyribosyltransferase